MVLKVEFKNRAPGIVGEFFAAVERMLQMTLIPRFIRIANFAQVVKKQAGQKLVTDVFVVTTIELFGNKTVKACSKGFFFVVDCELLEDFGGVHGVVVACRISRFRFRATKEFGGIML